MIGSKKRKATNPKPRKAHAAKPAPPTNSRSIGFDRRIILAGDDWCVTVGRISDVDGYGICSWRAVPDERDCPAYGTIGWMPGAYEEAAAEIERLVAFEWNVKPKPRKAKR
jgi:hypothetical protein